MRYFSVKNIDIFVLGLTRVNDQIAEAKVIVEKIPAWNLHVIKYMRKFLNL